MLIIRLQRLGKLKHPTYRLIVSEKSRDTQHGSLEILGNYAPVQNPPLVNLKKERIQHWISVGAQMSPTVSNLLISQGVIEGKKQGPVSLNAKRRKKISDKQAAAAEAKAKAAAEPAA